MKFGTHFKSLKATGWVALFFFLIFLVVGAAQTKIRSVKPAVKNIQKRTEAAKLPDLAVESVYLDNNCHLIIIIQNAGSGPVPDKDFKDCIVNVRFGRNQENFYLGASSKEGKPPVDPAGLLLKPGGRVSYNTGIRIQEELKAVVIIDSQDIISEENNDNNRSDTVALKPDCAYDLPALAASSIKPSPSKTERMDRVLQKKPETIPDRQKSIRIPPASATAVPQVSRAFDLISRRKSLVVLQGRSFGSSAGNRQVRLVRSNTAGNPVMSYFLNVQSWNQDEIIAEMPEALADPADPGERNRSLSSRSGRFTVGVYSRNENRWLSNERTIEDARGSDLDRDADGHRAVRFLGDDCDDEDGNRYPGNFEIGDFEGHDEDCNPDTIGRLDADRDTYTDNRVWNDPVQFGFNPGEREAIYGRDCDDSRADVHPGQVEVCNGRDDNCDGNIDEGVTVTAYRDNDRDLYGDPSAAVQICYSDLRSGLVTNGDDCNDSDPRVNPREGNCP